MCEFWIREGDQATELCTGARSSVHNVEAGREH